MAIIDFHTHAFPDELAKRAVPLLAEEGNIPAALDGTVSALIDSMDAAGIDASVVASIATKPNQFERILDWSAAIASNRIIPFPSVHPAAPDVLDQVVTIAERGFRGIKMHPYYQEFDLDEPRLWPLYERIADAGLALLMHTGYDVAFERIRKADPARIVKVVEAFPNLKLVTSHWGAWEDWEEVERRMLGRPIYMDVSFAIQFQPRERSRAWLNAHPMEYIVFGTDSPWSAQQATLDYVRSLELTPDREAALLGGNACRLLGDITL